MIQVVNGILQRRRIPPVILQGRHVRKSQEDARVPTRACTFRTEYLGCYEDESTERADLFLPSLSVSVDGRVPSRNTWLVK